MFPVLDLYPADPVHILTTDVGFRSMLYRTYTIYIMYIINICVI